MALSPLKRLLALVWFLGVTMVACQCPNGPKSPDAGSDAGPPPKPKLTALSITPSAGAVTGKTEVTVVGTGFEEGVTVSIGGNLLTDIVIQGETTLIGKTPAGIPGLAPVAVTRANETVEMEGAGFRYLCQMDDDCAPLQAGLRCEDGTGLCIPAPGCNLDSDQTCQSQDPENYCYVYGKGCRCVTEPNDAGTSGVCRRRRGVCESCTEDSQCGVGGVFEPAGACKALTSEPNAPKFCLQERQGGSCGCGMMDNGQGYCKPQSNDCSQVGCDDDKDCPGGSVCNKARCLCEAICRWDFARQALASPGCPVGTVCWVDNANLEPNSLFFGAGRCRPPCADDAQCQDTAQNPFGGDRLKCAAEVGSGGVATPNRCRANGECMDDLECPEAPLDVQELGYCDRTSLKCKSDCRLGMDPVTGQPFKDCRPGYKCAEGTNGQPNKCVLETCVEGGGARVACRRGQYCCGEDKNGDGMADPCPPADQREANDCYDAPVPPFCSKCEEVADCEKLTLPAWLTGPNACTNNSSSPNCSPLPYACVYAGNRPDDSEGISVCAPSTWNEATKDMKGCPGGYVPTIIRPDLSDGPNFCETNDDCRIGNSTAICAVDTSIVVPPGETPPKACKCSTPGESSGCPNDADAGLKSVCRYGNAPSICMVSYVCGAQPGIIYKDAGPPDFGCGL